MYSHNHAETVVGFEYLTYNVNEGQNANVEVCVKVYEPDDIDFYITGVLTTQDVTATGNVGENS